MGTHFKVIDGNIVYKVADEDTVIEELEYILDSQYKSEEGYESIGFIVHRGNDMEDPEDKNPKEVLFIECVDCGLSIQYKAAAPTLVNENGNLTHYWDFALDSTSQTELYESEDINSNVVGFMEDDIVDIICRFGKN